MGTDRNLVELSPEEEELYLLEKQKQSVMYTSSISTANSKTKNIKNIKDDDDTISTNNAIIDLADELIQERLKYKDPTLRLSEITQLKDTAFKQNQLLKNKATENVNINLNNLHEKTPQELFEMLKQLS